jgi:DNA-directed RNA polymerase subunit L
MAETTFQNLQIKQQNEISFEINNVELAIVNSLRRIILSEIPNFGFLFDSNEHYTTDINVLQNDTPLHNEFIQHRISLIPINVSDHELDNLNIDDYTFEIKVDVKDNITEITTEHIKVLDSNSVIHNDLSKRWFPPNSFTKDYILITKLKKIEDSLFHLRAKAITNIAKTNASFGVVSQCSVEFVIDQELAKNELKKQLKSSKNDDDEQQITDNFKTLDIQKCFHKNKYKEVNKLNMTICSECNLSPKYIFDKSLTILLNKLEKLKTSNYEIQNNNNLMSIIINDETHTLGNCLQALIFNHFIREKNTFNDCKLTYVGYTIPHPLEEILVIKIKGDNIISLHKTQMFFEFAIDTCIQYISNVFDEWNTFSIKYKL